MQLVLLSVSGLLWLLWLLWKRLLHHQLWLSEPALATDRLVEKDAGYPPASHWKKTAGASHWIKDD